MSHKKDARLIWVNYVPESCLDSDEMPQKAASLVDFEFTRDICTRKTIYIEDLT